MMTTMTMMVIASTSWAFKGLTFSQAPSTSIRKMSGVLFSTLSIPFLSRNTATVAFSPSVSSLARRSPLSFPSLPDLPFLPLPLLQTASNLAQRKREMGEERSRKKRSEKNRQSRKRKQLRRQAEEYKKSKLLSSKGSDNSNTAKEEEEKPTDLFEKYLQFIHEKVDAHPGQAFRWMHIQRLLDHLDRTNEQRVEAFFSTIIELQKKERIRFNPQTSKIFFNSLIEPEKINRLDIAKRFIDLAVPFNTLSPLKLLQDKYSPEPRFLRLFPPFSSLFRYFSLVSTSSSSPSSVSLSQIQRSHFASKFLLPHGPTSVTPTILTHLLQMVFPLEEKVDEEAFSLILPTINDFLSPSSHLENGKTEINLWSSEPEASGAALPLLIAAVRLNKKDIVQQLLNNNNNTSTLFFRVDIEDESSRKRFFQSWGNATYYSIGLASTSTLSPEQASTLLNKLVAAEFVDSAKQLIESHDSTYGTSFSALSPPPAPTAEAEAEAEAVPPS